MHFSLHLKAKLWYHDVLSLSYLVSLSPVSCDASGRGFLGISTLPLYPSGQKPTGCLHCRPWVWGSSPHCLIGHPQCHLWPAPSLIFACEVTFGFNCRSELRAVEINVCRSRVGANDALAYSSFFRVRPGKKAPAGTLMLQSLGDNREKWFQADLQSYCVCCVLICQEPNFLSPYKALSPYIPPSVLGAQQVSVRPDNCLPGTKIIEKWALTSSNWYPLPNPPSQGIQISGYVLLLI